jgi:4-hydroxybenzoate polyprenyltransferase
MRLDRPIGTWLLYWPCAWGLGLAGVGHRWDLFLWFALGAFAMRSAGCVYNDIVDKDLDARVERTRLRPLASGRVSVSSAWVLVALLLGIALIVLLQLNRTAQIVALASLLAVAAYPFMKRIIVVAAGVARSGLFLGRAGRLGRGNRQPRLAGGPAVVGNGRPGSSATTLSMRSRISRMMRWSG